ncbi:hypothetical protein DEU56DRAFT_766006 [Suillus clintonianus]|uniref:uncharacterized protein n=1 Tax=Suillus clintonianus TaxID=1904413 RepID=UPI001B877C69|nr:uncharacterized protein DEU56DRAFT_766006 [Suillus clintonianus]KAG2156200.1 hypothetical protein DEU56DRAFT_766006 [Suillus clintonianus]
MPTSELSQALNPYFAQPRPRSSNTQNQFQSIQPSQAHEPHHSELEVAISEPQRPPAASTTPPQNPAARLANASSSGAHPFQIVMNYLNSTRESQEIEQKRRLAWEQEQEAKYTLRQAEMERRMLEMQQELGALKAKIAFGTPKAQAASPSVQTPSEQHQTPITSPVLSHSSTTAGKHTSPDPGQPTPPSVFRHTSASSDAEPPAGTPSVDDIASPAHASPPLLSRPARFINVDPSSSRQGGPSNPRKRPTLGSTSGEDDSDASEYSLVERPIKRKNHHDTRCLTIQHAMRSHLLRVMQLEDDKHLPDGHNEGIVLGPSDPVRFVWDKTPKQSVHNGRMKERVLHDLRAHRHLYKHVPDKDFNKKSLESVFDQAFVTFRQKFRAQRDTSVAINQKQREDVKAMRSRRLSRKKTKLSNRSDARNKIEAFEHVVFDGALQVECMSSEESETEEDPIIGSRMTLRVRGFPWRSNRLLRFFDILDDFDKADNSQKPRRGVGRRERFHGLPKEGVILPPKGVATWMISKRWISVMQASHLEVLSSLKDVVMDSVGFDWSQFHALGEESEDEGRLDMARHHDMMITHNGLHFTHSDDSTTISAISSLYNALVHTQ